MVSNNIQDCICNNLYEIYKKQEELNKVFSNDLFLKPLTNTIPIFILCQNGNYFVGKGLFEDKNLFFNYFETPLFRILKIENDSRSAVIELLQLQNNIEFSSFNENLSVCKKNIVRTGIYITINCSSFIGVQCQCPVSAQLGTPMPSQNHSLLKVETSEFITISDGIKKLFEENDGIEGFNSIHDPKLYSYFNLFINGVIQPPLFYQVKKGELYLKTEDVPTKGTNIILQMVKITNDYKPF